MLHVGARTRSNALRPLQSADYEDGDDQTLYIHTYIMCVTSTRVYVSCGEEKKSGKPVFGKLRFLTHVKRKTAQ
jgi:hypothetical protein